VRAEQLVLAGARRHASGATAPSSRPSPTRTSTSGAGEVAAQLAWIDHLLGDQLDDRVPGVRARIRHEVDRRVLTPFVTRRDWHWLGLDGDVHNWCAWIHGNVLVAGLRLMPDGRGTRVELVGLVLGGLARYAASIPADGAIDEGYAYWWNGACRALEALDVLEHASRGALGGDPDRGPARVRRLPASQPPRRGVVPQPGRRAGARCPPATNPGTSLHRAARRVGDRAAEAHAAAHRRPARSPVAGDSQGLGRLLRALTDPAWIAAGRVARPCPARCGWRRPRCCSPVRRPGPASDLTLAVKGGHNGEHPQPK
jgi:hypothetical protein